MSKATTQYETILHSPRVELARVRGTKRFVIITAHPTNDGAPRVEEFSGRWAWKHAREEYRIITEAGLT